MKRLIKKSASSSTSWPPQEIFLHEILKTLSIFSVDILLRLNLNENVSPYLIQEPIFIPLQPGWAARCSCGCVKVAALLSCCQSPRCITTRRAPTELATTRTSSCTRTWGTTFQLLLNKEVKTFFSIWYYCVSVKSETVYIELLTLSFEWVLNTLKNQDFLK